MMNNQEIFEKLRSIVKSINGSAMINEESALVAEFILDSLEFMNYITKVEETYKLNISDTEIKVNKLGIISNMVTYLSSKINKDG